MNTSTYNVLVYKTDVASNEDAETIVNGIKKYYPDHIVFFDLLQPDRILWIEGWDTRGLIAVELLMQLGYSCDFVTD